MIVINPGDYVAPRGTLGAGTLGFPVYYREIGKPDAKLMFMTNFHNFALPLGIQALRGEIDLVGKIVMGGHSRNNLKPIGKVVAYDVPHTQQPNASEFDHVDALLIRLNSDVMIGRFPNVTALRTSIFPSHYFSPQLISRNVDSAFFGDLDPYNFSNKKTFLGEIHLMKKLEAAYKNKMLPNFPYVLGDLQAIKGQNGKLNKTIFVSKISSGTGYSIGVIKDVYAKASIRAVHGGYPVTYYYNHINYAKTIFGTGQLEGDSGSPVFDLFSGTLYGMIMANGGGGNYGSIHKWYFNSATQIFQRFNNEVLRKFNLFGRIG